MNKLKATQKEYHMLSLLLINTTEMKDFPSHKNDWKTFEINNKLALNIYETYKSEEIRHAYISKLKTRKSSNLGYQIIAHVR